MTYFFNACLSFPSGINLLINITVSVNSCNHLIGKCVNTRNPNSVKTSRNFVRIFIKLTSGSNFGHYNLQCRFLFFLVKIDRNTTPIIHNFYGVSFFYRDSYRITISCQSLIDRVIHDFINQMVETSDPYITNVHRRTHTNVLHSFQCLNTTCCILFLTHIVKDSRYKTQIFK